MNDFQEMLRAPGDRTTAAVSLLTEPATILDEETDSAAGGWVPWNG